MGHIGSLVVALLFPFTGCLIKRVFAGSKSYDTLRSGEGVSGIPAARNFVLWGSQQQVRSVWLLIYPLMGLSSWRIYINPQPHAVALALYVALLVATWLCWPPIFLPHKPQAGLLDLAVMGSLLWSTCAWFSALDKGAALLLLPYLGWTVFATVLINSLDTSPASEGGEARHFAAAKRHANPPRIDTNMESADDRLGQNHTGSLLPPLPTLSPAAVPPRAAHGPAGLPIDLGSNGAQPVASPSWLGSRSPFPTTGPRFSQDGERASGVASGMVSRQSSGALRNSVGGVAGLLSRVSSTLSDTLGSAGSALLRATSLRKSISAEEDDTLMGEPCSDSISMKYFQQPGSAGFKVRGQNYLVDKKKYEPEAPAMTLGSVNLINQKRHTFHIARFLPSIRDSPAPFTFVWQIMVPNKQNLAFVLAWQLPYDPVAAVNKALLSIPEEEGGRPLMDDEELANMASDPAWQLQQRAEQSDTGDGEANGISESAAEGAEELPASASPERKGHRRSRSRLEEVAQGAGDRTLFGNPKESPAKAPPKAKALEPTPYSNCKPFDVSVMRMLDESGDEDAKQKRRNSVFKVIPRIAEGSWMVRQAVGTTPALLGNKLTTKYFRGPRYLEVDLDVGSSRSASHVVGLVNGALKGLTIDLAIVLEGRFQDELPESLLGTVRLIHLDLTQAADLDNDTGIITDAKL
ncbi:hypothetical protein WJX73_005835 [Symbiochloris irregularis]|uniref:Protein ENHANCED DISEASE RESISTANCE 2 C-terminal domain-containing protein n=1 Tax=Symbiochloris irregularis TaxID=706552 RepID=A0AAW1P993_9CHLO